MEEAIYTEKRGPLTVKIFQDPEPMSPEEMGDDNLFLVHFHRDFWIESKVVSEEQVRNYFEGENKELAKRYWIFPVAAYIHGGVVLSLGSGSHFPDYQWDVSHVGAVLVAKEEWKRSKKARSAAESLVETWNSYLSGNVYGFVVEDENGETVDSCWGFYGEEGLLRGRELYQYCLDEARSNADWELEQRTKKHCQRLKAQIQRGVPIDKRQPLIA